MTFNWLGKELNLTGVQSHRPEMVDRRKMEKEIRGNGNKGTLMQILLLDGVTSSGEDDKPTWGIYQQQQMKALIGSSTWESHLKHLDVVFSILATHQLFVKKEKCCFGVSQIHYLGHLIKEGEVKMDPNKIAAIEEWPKPTTVTAMRGFLGLTGYYRKFVKDYGKIAAPLTEMLKKNNFKWSHEAELAFVELK
ncbi:uncharacterized protein LOC112090761 [Morus notabilis]|uniref:uncharacterized protein LOC112090761 n=1 Tax=Morus notabilis TaxID=981085 RepID=UPI000CECF59A|nr:uncharacterized protein LOC112090761 [Morus notabilis]